MQNNKYPRREENKGQGAKEFMGENPGRDPAI
jgi:hypothetical protein